jgi:hypothetical protein
MVWCEKERTISAVMTIARVRTKKIVKMRDEIISKAYKGVFQNHLFPEIKGDVILPIISA